MKHNTNDRPPMVLSYLRFSTSEQLKGDSTRRQLDLSERYAAERGWAIDTSMSDKGISAFRGSNATSGALAKLLELVKDKQIPRGSVLLVESLDRLSRNEITEALELFLSLVRSGLRIITLADDREYRQGQLELSGLMYSLMIMSRAHEESETKSKRIGAAWRNKRANLDKKPLTSIVPSWLEVRGEKIVVHEAKAAVVKRIFRMVLDGHGLTAIVKRLNKEDAEIGRSYVFKILHSRATIGEFQPHRIVHSDGKRLREPAGEPVKNYFPAVVDEQTFYAAQAVLTKRRQHRGPNSKFINLFKGLLHDAKDKSPMRIVQKDRRAYASGASLEGRSRHAVVAFPVAAFEAAFVLTVSEKQKLDLKDSRVAELTHELQAVKGKLQGVVKRIDQINASLADTASDVPESMLPTMMKLDAERTRLTAEQESIRQRIAIARVGSPVEAAEQIAKLTFGIMSGDISEVDRLELQQAIAQLVQRIDCRTDRKGVCTSCDVMVTMSNGATIGYTVTAKHKTNEITITGADGSTTTATVTFDGEEKKPSGIPLQTVERVKELWQQSLRPALIAKECKVSTSQIYRIAGKLKRLKPFKAANRWDGYKKAG